jgi:hypothetical protein
MTSLVGFKNEVVVWKQKNVRYMGGLREGQVLINALFEYDRETYNAINQSPADCFYDDSRIEAFYTKLKEIWREKKS